MHTWIHMDVCHRRVNTYYTPQKNLIYIKTPVQTSVSLCLMQLDLAFVCCSFCCVSDDNEENQDTVEQILKCIIENEGEN